MNPLTMLWTDIRTLVVDTGRIWWRLLPQLTAIFLLGWLGTQLALKLAVIAGDLSAWLALIIFSFGFLSQLVAIVLMLRLVGGELRINQLMPAEEMVNDDRDSSISHLLAVTLLPFLGIYAAFGKVAESADQLATEQMARQGIGGVETSILGVLAAAAQNRPQMLAAVVVGTYILRRIVDQLHERSRWRVLGLLVAFIESFLILTVILGAIRILQGFKIWLADRAFVGWLVQLRDVVGGFLSIFTIDLPAVLVAVGDFLAEQLWPVFFDVISQPIIWLAIAALVFGSKVSSVADMWRKGQPIVSRAPGAGRVAGLGKRLPISQIQSSSRARQVGLEIREAFLGDIDDKYLPTFHSIRLVLRAGVVFLGAFVLVYAIPDITENYLRSLVLALIGGHQIEFWLITSPFFDLLYDLPFEPLRMCLLAVAFHRCLLLFLAKAHPQDRPTAAVELVGESNR